MELESISPEDNSNSKIIKENGPSGVSESDAGENSQTIADLYQYEAQHYGFTPTSLINGMFNSVCDLYREALKAFSKACFEKFPTVMTEDELTTARRAVAENIDRDICTVFDALEHYLLAQVFSIPESVVLPEDRCQLLRQSEEETDQMERRKIELKKEILAVKFANAQLDEHRKKTQVLQESLDEILNKLSSGDAQVGGLNAQGVGDFISYYSEVLRTAMRPGEEA